MSLTHFYYAINRKAAERVFNLTWNQFLEKYGWDAPMQWENVGEYLAFALDRPTLAEQPTAKQLAPILRKTIRQTLPRMGPLDFVIDVLGHQMGKKSFVKVDVNAECQVNESGVLTSAAVFAFLGDEIDARTLWCMLTLHGDWTSEFFCHWRRFLETIDLSRLKAVRKRFGPCHPVFDWQKRRDMTVGQGALHEDDTRLFVRFVQFAWRKNDKVYANDKRHFRDFDLVRKLHAVSSAMPGNCLIRYLGD